MDHGTGKEQCLGEMGFHQIQFMHHNNDGFPLVVPRFNEGEQQFFGVKIDGGKGFIQNHNGAILQNEPGKKEALKLAPGEGVDQSGFKTGEANAGQGGINLFKMGGCIAAMPSHHIAQTHGGHFPHGNGKMVIQDALLGHIGQILAPGFGPDDAPTCGFEEAINGFDQGAFPAPIGTHNSREGTFLKSAGDFVEGAKGPIVHTKIIYFYFMGT